MSSRWFLIVLFVMQFICAFFFISDIVINVAGIRTRPINWQFRELIEIGAALGLTIGTVLGVITLFRAQRRTRHVESQLRIASGAFADLLEERFADWGLTPAERDVAWFAVKGMSTQEIANLRNTSEGTVKAQSNAIYRKAGVSGRYQLLSQFVDELMAGAAAITHRSDAEDMPTGGK